MFSLLKKSTFGLKKPTDPAESIVLLTLFPIILFVYAAFSTPFPRSIGFSEVFIFALLLLVSVALPFIIKRTGVPPKAFYILSLFFCLLALAGISALYSRISGQQILAANFFRDFVPFCFLLLLIPLSILFEQVKDLYSVNSDHSIYSFFLQKFPEVISLCRLILAFRAISNPEFIQQGGLAMLGQDSIVGDYNYYQYDSLVLFSAIYSTFDFIKRLLLPPQQFNSYLKFFVLSWLQLFYRMSTIVVIMLSYLSILQRLPILLVFVSAVVLVAICIPYSFNSKKLLFNFYLLS